MHTNAILATSLRHIVLAAAALACTLPAMHASAASSDWGSGERIQGSGNIKKQERALNHFTALSLSLPGKLELHMGNTENVSIETDDNLLGEIETIVEDGVLKIRPLKRNVNLHTRTLKIWVNAKTMERLSLGGSGSIESDLLRARELQFDLGGSGSINLKGMEADAVTVNLGGSGNLKSAGGKAGKLAVSIGGSGNVDLGQVNAASVMVSVAGSGGALVWANNSLSVTIAGSGDVRYYGQPSLTRTIIGSGDVRSLGAAPHN